MYYLVLLLYFACFALLAQALVAILWPKTTVFSEQLNFYEKSWREAHSDVKEREIPEGAGFKERLKTLTVNSISRGRPVDFIEKKLESSGLSMSWTEFVYYHFLGVCLGGIVMYMLGGLVVAVIFVAATAWLPIKALDYLIARRRLFLNNQLPETLTMISSSLKAGYSLLQSVDTVSKETTPPMLDEFKRVLSDSRLGLPVEQALEKMGARVKSTNFDWMVLAVKIQREVGGNLAEVLATLAKTIREREQLVRQIHVLTAEGRLSALILLCLPGFVMLALYILNPQYMNLMFTTTAGLAMLAIAVFLMGIGTLWLRQVVRIEV